MSSESALLNATRDLLRIKLGEKYESKNINVEIDADSIPNIAANGYLAIVPGSIGIRDQQQPLLNDEDIGLSVWVFKRVANVPKDRRRSTFLDMTAIMQQSVAEVRSIINGSYTLLQDANSWVQAGTGEFVEPLLFQGTGRYEQFVGDLTKGISDNTLGLRREIRFGQARFMERC